jgi:two-component system, OmpR family, sensor kinase
MRRPTGLRTGLIASAVAGAAITLAVLVSAFNLILDSHLRTNADNLLRERAATVLRGLGTVDGRLSVIEAPDRSALDAQTWIFAGSRVLEQPAGGDPRNHAAARELGAKGSGFRTVEATDTRLEAVPVRSGKRRLGTVVVGTSLSPYESTASSALIGSVILGLLALAGVAALSLWLIGRALRPVARMTARAADWSERDLSQRFYTGEPHDELTSLASVLDGLLARLSASLAREQLLTAEISHELRTPLAKIQAEAELMGGRERSTQEYRDSLQLIRRYAGELQRVLETLLASARAAGGHGTRSDAREAARRAVEPVRDQLTAEGKSVELVCSGPTMVAAEAELVERILAPLLENAGRYARSRVTLELAGSDGQVLFEVRDDGPGVAADERERIFDAGFRGAAGKPDEHQRAGLGLPLVRRLARAAGGEVEARETLAGASFRVRLPSTSGRAGGQS